MLRKLADAGLLHPQMGYDEIAKRIAAETSISRQLLSGAVISLMLDTVGLDKAIYAKNQNRRRSDDASDAPAPDAAGTEQMQDQLSQLTLEVKAIHWEVAAVRSQLAELRGLLTQLTTDERFVCQLTALPAPDTTSPREVVIKPLAEPLTERPSVINGPVQLPFDADQKFPIIDSEIGNAEWVTVNPEEAGK